MEPSEELELLTDRVLGARDRLRLMPFAGPGQPGPIDPDTGESWDRLHVLGHLAEFLPYWTRQLRMAMLTGRPIGRGEAGYRARQTAIEGGSKRGERALRAGADAACGPLLRLLANLGPHDLDRDLVHDTRGPTTVREVLERYLVGHLEAHLDQLIEATPASI